MWQEIAVLIIGLIVVFYVGMKIYKFILHPPKASDPCHGCTGCALKEKCKSTGRSELLPDRQKQHKP